MTTPPTYAGYAQGAWNTPKPPDSFRAALGNLPARNEWMPQPISSLGPSQPPDWIWEKYIARGCSTLFTALWKSGKTTLICHLLRDLARGGGLIGQAKEMLVLVITEETNGMWSRRRDELGLTDSVHIISRPFASKPNLAGWTEFVTFIAHLVQTYGYGLVIFDTLPSLWSVMQENDASEVCAALMPLNQITSLNAGVLLVHHPRKGGGDEAQGSRGSGALPGYVDAIVEMKRHSKDDATDRRRVLTVFSRLNDQEESEVIELRDAGYVVLGDKVEVTKKDRVRDIADVLPTEEPGWTVEEVREHWPTLPKPGESTLRGDLKNGAAGGRWRQTGDGAKGSPFRYSLAGFVSRSTEPIGVARNESEMQQPLPGRSSLGHAPLGPEGNP